MKKRSSVVGSEPQVSSLAGAAFGVSLEESPIGGHSLTSRSSLLVGIDCSVTGLQQTITRGKADVNGLAVKQSFIRASGSTVFC